MIPDGKAAGKGADLREAIEDAWRHARDRGLFEAGTIAVEGEPGEANPNVWFKVVDIWVGGYNPITQYRVLIEPSSDPPEDPHR